jgi:hypothetical protein
MTQIEGGVHAASSKNEERHIDVGKELNVQT